MLEITVYTLFLVFIFIAYKIVMRVVDWLESRDEIDISHHEEKARIEKSRELSNL